MRYTYISPACLLLLAQSLFGGQPFPAPHQARFAAKASAKAGHPEGPTYRYLPIEFPGAFLTAAGDVNDRGMVAGQYLEFVEGEQVNRTFTWYKGDYQSIIYPGAPFTLVFALTENNLLFGNWGTLTEQHAGSYDLRTRKFSQLPDIKGKPLNFGYRLNEKGVAVGAACEGDLMTQINCVGWRRDDGHYTFFSAKGAADGGAGTIPNSINDSDLEVGFWDEAKAPFDFHSYVRDKHSFAEIHPFGLANSTAYDINNRGQILMLAPLDPTAYWRPLLWERGRATALPLYPDVANSHTLYTGINNSGDLAGYWLDADFFPTSFVALRK